MTKRENIDDPSSCLNKAADDAIMFIIYDKDPAMAKTIRFWITERIRLGLNIVDDAKLVSADKLQKQVLEVQKARMYDSENEGYR